MQYNFDNGIVQRLVRDRGLCPLHTPTLPNDLRQLHLHGHTLFMQCWHLREPAHWLICDLRTGVSLPLQLPEAKNLAALSPADENGMLDLVRHSDHYILNYVHVSTHLLSPAASALTLIELPSEPLLRLPNIHASFPDVILNYQCALNARRRLVVESHTEGSATMTCVYEPSLLQQQQAPPETLPGRQLHLTDDWLVTVLEPRDANQYSNFEFFDFTRMRRTNKPYTCRETNLQAVCGDLLLILTHKRIDFVNMATAQRLHQFAMPHSVMQLHYRDGILHTGCFDIFGGWKLLSWKLMHATDAIKIA